MLKEDKLTAKEWEIREAAENDLLTFINLVAPYRVLGAVHEDVIDFWQNPDKKSHDLTILPRDHQKSALMAFRTTQRICKDPIVTMIYLSSTSTLAEKQLKMIKDLLTSSAVMKYWPDLIHPEEGKRERWTNNEIIIDHPLRRKEGIRDATVFTGGLTTSLTGLHCNVAVFDDIVVKENAYTEDGRQKTREQYSLLASVETADAEEWVTGTRYHPTDLYDDLVKMEEEIYDKDGNVVSTVPVFDVLQRQVETDGEFLWPRQQRYDGKWFGFNEAILAKKKAKYLDRTQFYAQYYNNPNNPEGSGVKTSKFQYYDPRFIKEIGGRYFFNDTPLNIYAGVDFAFSLKKKADYSCIVVIGVDPEWNVYVLDIVRFKSDGNIAEYYEHIAAMHLKWNIKVLRAETAVAQKAIVRELKNVYLKQNGLSLKIDEFHPTRHGGTKEERVSSILDARYDNLSMWHYRGGNCSLLEEELKLEKPPHDDIKDSLAAAVDIAKAPMLNQAARRKSSNVIQYHNRFGGVSH